MSTDHKIEKNSIAVLSEVLIGKLGLAEDHVQSFYKLSQIKVLDKKSFLIKGATVCSFIGIVVFGSLRSFILSEDSEFNNDFFFQGSFVSAYTSFLTRRPTNCHIQAMNKCVVICISYEHFQELINQDKEWYKLSAFVAETFFITKCRRETMFLIDAAAARYDKVLAMYPGLEQRVAQYHIASYVGVKPESLSRVKLLSYTEKKEAATIAMQPVLGDESDKAV